jgi:hypothetical protein
VVHTKSLMTGALALGASGGDRTVKAVIFWLLIIALAAGIAFAVRRARSRRSSAPDDWRRDAGGKERGGPTWR